jgi:ABC-type uncharacterized transport system permease subunit
MPVIPWIIAICFIILAAIVPGHTLIKSASNPEQIIHIVISTLAFGVILFAGVQAILLALQDYLLRRIRTHRIIQLLPPLETMEQLLFQVILVGFILLTTVLITSIIFFHPIFAPALRQKSLLTIIAWTIFAILLVGRYSLGWRGRTAIFWTLAGTLLLVMLYFGSLILLK